MRFLRRVRYPKAPVVAFAREWAKHAGLNYAMLKAMHPEAADSKIFVMMVDKLAMLAEAKGEDRAAEYASLREAAATAHDLAEFVGAAVAIVHSTTNVAWLESEDGPAFIREVHAAVLQGLEEADVEIARLRARTGKGIP